MLKARLIFILAGWGAWHAQRTDEPAEGTVTEHAEQADHRHDDPLVGEKRA